MIFLQGHDISEAYASRIYNKYGAETIDTMRSDPYLLIRDIRGIGFIKADQVAKKIGIAKDSPERVRAGILFTLDDLVDKGHVYVPLKDLIETTADMLDLDAESVVESLEYLKQQRKIIDDDGRVYLSCLYDNELELSRRLKLIAATRRTGQSPQNKEIREIISEIEKNGATNHSFTETPH